MLEWGLSSALSLYILVLVKGEGHKKTRRLPLRSEMSIFIFASCRGSMNCTLNLCIHDISANEDPHSGVENTESAESHSLLTLTRNQS